MIANVDLRVVHHLKRSKNTRLTYCLNEGGTEAIDIRAPIGGSEDGDVDVLVVPLGVGDYLALALSHGGDVAVLIHGSH